MKQKSLFPQIRQKGSALIISLLFLLVLTIIGISSMGTTMLEEKMSGNLRDQQLAFQAAESALQSAETYIEKIVSTADFKGTGGLFGETNLAPDPYASGTWGTGCNCRTITLEGTNGAEYYIKYIGEIPEDALPMISDYSKPVGNPPKSFQITARGYGPTGTSAVILREYYGRRM